MHPGQWSLEVGCPSPCHRQAWPQHGLWRALGILPAPRLPCRGHISRGLLPVWDGQQPPQEAWGRLRTGPPCLPSPLHTAQARTSHAVEALPGSAFYLPCLFAEGVCVCVCVVLRLRRGSQTRSLSALPFPGPSTLSGPFGWPGGLGLRGSVQTGPLDPSAALLPPTAPRPTAMRAGKRRPEGRTNGGLGPLQFKGHPVGTAALHSRASPRSRGVTVLDVEAWVGSSCPPGPWVRAATLMAPRPGLLGASVCTHLCVPRQTRVTKVFPLGLLI